MSFPELVAFRRNPCAIIIDCRSRAITDQQDAINQWLRDFIEEAKCMLTREIDRVCVDAGIITVGNKIEAGGIYRNVEVGFPELQLEYGTGASLEEAVEIALDLLEERKHEVLQEGFYCNKPKLYILSADIVNYCASLTEPENRLHRMICDNKIKFYPIICMPKFLADAGKRYLRDACLPTLQAPLKIAMYVSEDYWSIPVCDFSDEPVPQIDPTKITLGI